MPVESHATRVRRRVRQAALDHMDEAARMLGEAAEDWSAIGEHLMAATCTVYADTIIKSKPAQKEEEDVE